MRAALLGICLILAITPSAEAAGLRLTKIATAASQPVADPAASRLAYLSSPTRLSVRTIGRATRTYPVSSGCSPQAMGGGVLALGCQSGPQTLLDLTTGASGGLPAAVLSGENSFVGVHGIGAQWLLEDTSSSPDEVHQVVGETLINWRSGRTIDMGASDPFGSRAYPDLDSVAPSRRLCTPLRRARGYEPFNEVRYAYVQEVEKWVLQTGVANQLQQCGSHHIEKFSSAADVVLGDHAIGYLRGRRIVFRDLRTGHSWTGPWPSARRPVLAMYGRRLVVAVGSSSVSYVLYQART